MRLRTSAILCAVSSIAIAQSSMQIPSGGFFYNSSTAAVHPILGIPGASILGAPVLVGVQAASVSSDGDAAVAVTTDGVFAVTGLLSGAAQWQLLTTSVSPFLISWGNVSAVVYVNGAYSSITRTGQAWTVTDLSVNLPPGTVKAIDYDENGQRVLIALATQDQNGGVYVFSTGDSTVHHIFSLPNPASITHSQDNVLVLDGDTSGVWIAAMFDESPRPSLIPITQAPDSHLTAIAMSQDGKHLYAADAGLRQIAVYELSGILVAQLPVAAPLSKLERLGGGSLWLLSGASAQSIYLLNDTASPQVFFVPAVDASKSGDVQ